jgi:HEAT repeat protein
MPLIRKPQGTAGAPPPDAAAVLQALVGGSEDERWAAARSAAELPNSVTALATALANETSARVREAILTALVRIATPQCVEAIIPLLRKDDARVRTAATDALTALREVAWPYVAQLLRDASPHVRVLACELVRHLPGEQAVPLFCAVLETDPEANVCAAAVEALAEIGGSAALPALQRCAERFSSTPFLAFSITVAIDRARAQSTDSRA